MDNSWATQNLQVIRTLMERAAVYRRAMAPVMIVTGSIGTAGAVVAWLTKIQSARGFSLLWMAISLLALLASFLLVRWQAFRDKEPFWSPPTRRIIQALSPPFLAGLVGGCLWALYDDHMPAPPGLLAAAWLACYGCGLHAAGFFMVRGIKLFGWIFLLAGCALAAVVPGHPDCQKPLIAHYIMGAFFGLLHLAYGVYLYFTETTRNQP